MSGEKETVAQFIKNVQQVDKIKIAIELAGNTHVEAYGYQKASAENTTIADWLDTRIHPRLPHATKVTVYTKADKVAGGYEAIKFSRRTF